MESNLIYIEIDDNFLFLSEIDKQKDKFFLNKKNIINLNNLEFKDGVLYNLSAVYLHIKNFLKINNLKKPEAIICITKLRVLKGKDLLQKLNTLKVALCACKTGLKIQKIINYSFLTKDEIMSPKNFFYKKDLENRLDFFKIFNPPPKKNPFKWFLFSGLTLVCLMLSLYITQVDKNSQLNLLKNQNIEILEQSKKLEEKIKILHSVKNENDKLRLKIEKIEKIKTSLNNPINILITIANSIPENSWLTNITFGQSANLQNQDQDKNLKKPQKLELEGITTQEEEITSFLNTLCQSKDLNNLKLSKIQKVKKVHLQNTHSDQRQPHYYFKFTGDIKIA